MTRDRMLLSWPARAACSGVLVSVTSETHDWDRRKVPGKVTGGGTKRRRTSPFWGGALPRVEPVVGSFDRKNEGVGLGRGSDENLARPESMGGELGGWIFRLGAVWGRICVSGLVVVIVGRFRFLFVGFMHRYRVCLGSCRLLGCGLGEASARHGVVAVSRLKFCVRGSCQPGNTSIDLLFDFPQHLTAQGHTVCSVTGNLQ